MRQVLQSASGTGYWIKRKGNWIKRKGTTGKIEPPQQLLLEEMLTFQKKISGDIFYHDIPKN